MLPLFTLSGGSLEQSALINEAAGVIRSPHQRGIHLLKVNGIELDESASQPENMFLFEMMEVNENIDDATDLDQLVEIKKQNALATNLLQGQICECFDKEKHDEALRLLQQMKYRERVEIRVEDKIEIMSN